MMHSAEPMTLGSPSSPPVGGPGMVQSPFLPSYLMGDTTPLSSPQPRMWTGGNSPPPSAHTPSLMTPTSPTSASFHNNSRLDRTSEMLRTRKEKSGAPPVSGLLEDIASPAALDKSKLNMSHSRGLFSQSLLGNTSLCGGLHQDDSVIYAPNVSTLNNSQVYPKRAPASPAQIDPFYTQGESIRPDDCFDETWITVFGFPAAASSFILQQFSQYGNIIKHVVATDGNWLHIKYQSKLQAKKALSKNGKVFGNSIMVGVAPCIDKTVMDNKENMDLSTSILNTPTQALSGTPNMDSRRNTPIRPLTAAYKAAASERQVNGNVTNPQKNSGIVTKAMEYIFGW